MLHIDYYEIANNAKKIKSKCNTPLCAVVKSDAYGHGAVRTVSVLDGIADCYAVATVAEAVEVAPYTQSDIAVLTPVYSVDELCLASKHNLVLTICNEESLRAAVGCVLPIRCQIKVDSGMSRLGFKREDLPAVCEAIKSCRSLHAIGVFSHLWGERKNDVSRQLAYFNQCADLCMQALGKRLCIHIANTNAAINLPQTRLDMVRVGLGLYGYGDDDLVPAKTVTAPVIAVRRVKRYDVLGYGGKNRAKRDEFVAVVQSGYANGLARTLVGGTVLVGKNHANIGGVCMGMTLLETGDYLPHVGESATLLGKGVNPSNLHTIVYELLCNLR